MTAESDAAAQALLAALGRAVELVDGQDRLIDERAREVAKKHVAEASAMAAARVAEAQAARDAALAEAGRKDSLIDELRRQLDVAGSARNVALRERYQAEARVDELLGTLGQPRRLVPSYVADVVEALRVEVPDCDTNLLRLYALLTMTVGAGVTLEQVHDAWALWRAGTPQGHEALVPFGELEPGVRELDRPYAEAIRRVALRLRPGGVEGDTPASNGVGAGHGGCGPGRCAYNPIHPHPMA